MAKASYPNQRVITIKKANKTNKIFTVMVKEHLLQAMKDLKPVELKVYLWLGMNQDGHTMDLSPAAIGEQIGTDRANVKRAIDGLEAKGYIIEKPGKTNEMVFVEAKTTTESCVKLTTEESRCQNNNDSLLNQQQVVVKLTTDCCQIDARNKIDKIDKIDSIGGTANADSLTSSDDAVAPEKEQGFKPWQDRKFLYEAYIAWKNSRSPKEAAAMFNVKVGDMSEAYDFLSIQNKYSTIVESAMMDIDNIAAYALQIKEKDKFLAKRGLKDIEEKLLYAAGLKLEEMEEEAAAREAKEKAEREQLIKEYAKDKDRARKDMEKLHQSLTKELQQQFVEEFEAVKRKEPEEARNRAMAELLVKYQQINSSNQ